MALVSQGNSGAARSRTGPSPPAEALITEYSYKYTPEPFRGPGRLLQAAAAPSAGVIRPYVLSASSGGPAMRPRRPTPAMRQVREGLIRTRLETLTARAFDSIGARFWAKGHRPAPPSYCCVRAKRRSRRCRKRSGSADHRGPGHEPLLNGPSRTSPHEAAAVRQLSPAGNRQLGLLGSHPEHRCCLSWRAPGAQRA